MGLFRSNARRGTQGRSQGGISPVAGGLIGSVLHYVVARKVIGRVARVGGIQGMLLGAAASYAINKFMGRRGRFGS